jgi:hypothetical protein
VDFMVGRPRKIGLYNRYDHLHCETFTKLLTYAFSHYRIGMVVLE